MFVLYRTYYKAVELYRLENMITFNSVQNITQFNLLHTAPNAESKEKTISNSNSNNNISNSSSNIELSGIPVIDYNDKFLPMNETSSSSEPFNSSSSSCIQYPISILKYLTVMMSI